MQQVLRVLMASSLSSLVLTSLVCAWSVTIYSTDVTESGGTTTGITINNGTLIDRNGTGPFIGMQSNPVSGVDYILYDSYLVFAPGPAGPSGQEYYTVPLFSPDAPVNWSANTQTMQNIGFEHLSSSVEFIGYYQTVRDYETYGTDGVPILQGTPDQLFNNTKSLFLGRLATTGHSSTLSGSMLIVFGDGSELVLPIQSFDPQQPGFQLCAVPTLVSAFDGTIDATMHDLYVVGTAPMAAATNSPQIVNSSALSQQAQTAAPISELIRLETVVASNTNAIVESHHLTSNDAQNTTLLIELPSNERIATTRTSLSQIETDRFVWTGRTDEEGIAQFAVNGGAITGYITRPNGETYRVRGDASGAVSLWKEDDTQEHATCGLCSGYSVSGTGLNGHAKAEPSPIALPTTSTMAAGSSSFVLDFCDDGEFVDIFVPYTTRAKNEAGGTAAIESEIDLAIAYTNMAYANSSIPETHNLRLVGTQEINYDDSATTVSESIGRLATGGDGFLDDVLGMQHAFSADLVALIIGSDVLNNDRAAGIANTPGQYSVSRFRSFFNVLFAHETGHNRGGGHQLGGASRTTSNHAYGFTDADGFFRRTIMWSVLGAHLPHYSNPLVNFMGIPMGVAGESDNAGTIIDTFDQTRSFRCSQLDDCTVHYQLHDHGNVFSSQSFSGAFDLVWMSQFNVAPGGEELVQLRVGFGFLRDPIDATIAIWDDPNNDGLPDDATVIATFGPVQASQSKVVTIRIPPTSVGAVGESFFVGAAVAQPNNERPPGSSQYPSAGRSFLIQGATPDTIANATFIGTPINDWLITARGAEIGSDCNANGLPDLCDVTEKRSSDRYNADGVPDECQICDAVGVFDYLTRLAVSDPITNLAAPEADDYDVFDLFAFFDLVDETCP